MGPKNDQNKLIVFFKWKIINKTFIKIFADGNKLNITFHGCRRDLELQCLGDWASDNPSERFVAFVDEKASENEPKFRCGVRKSFKGFIHKLRHPIDGQFFTPLPNWEAF